MLQRDLFARTFARRYSEIPSWVKRNAGLWADDVIDDATFIEVIQYLVVEGIITVPS